MNVYPVPDALANHYHGRGIALAAITGRQVVALIYVRDIIPDFEDTVEAAPSIASDARLAKIARALERDFGHVVVGMVSSWEFVEL